MFHQNPFSLKKMENKSPPPITPQRCQWEQEEKIKFAVFVYFFKEYYRICQQITKNCWKFWRKISLFILTKNPNQCRIYHKNIIKNYQSQQLFLESLKIIFTQFSNILECYQPELINIRNYLIKEQSLAASFKISNNKQKSSNIKEQYCQSKTDKQINKQQDLAFMKTKTQYQSNNQLFIEEMQHQKSSTFMHHWWTTTSLEKWIGYQEEENYRQCHLHFLNYLEFLRRANTMPLNTNQQ